MQSEAWALAVESNVLVPAPAPTVVTTTRAPIPDPFYRITLEGANYYSFAEVFSPDCTLAVVGYSSQLAESGNFSAAASVDGDASTCFQTPEANMSVYGPTYIVYACDARTRSFSVDTASSCGFGPVTSYVIEWSWGNDGASDANWYALDDLIMPGAPTTTTTQTPAATSSPSSTATTTERTDQRANLRAYSEPDCTGAALWGVESMDLCYYEYPDGNFTSADGKTRSVEVLKPNVWVSVYETCLFRWNDAGNPGYLDSFVTEGCHNVQAGQFVGALEVVVAGSQLCQGGYAQGTAVMAAGVALLVLYTLCAMCPLVYHAVFVAQCCVEKQKRKQIVFRD